MAASIPNMALSSQAGIPFNPVHPPAFRHPRSFDYDPIKITFSQIHDPQEFSQNINSTSATPQNSIIHKAHNFLSDDEIVEDAQSIAYEDQAQLRQVKKSRSLWSEPSSQLFHRIRECLMEVEHLFLQQLQNLRNQKQFLLAEIGKKVEREKKYMGFIKKLKKKVELYQKQNVNLKEVLTRTGDIDKVGNAVGKKCSKCECDDTINTNDVTRPLKYSKEYREDHEQIIQNLCNKFESLIAEYRKKRNPSVRKQCAKLAKNINHMKTSAASNPRSSTRNRSMYARLSTF